MKLPKKEKASSSRDGRTAMKGRNLLTRRGGLSILGLLLLGALALFVFSRSPKGVVAVVERNGEEALRQELSQLEEEKEVELEGENGIRLRLLFSPTGAAVLSSQCPDKVCVHAGKLTQAGEAAVCLPAKVVLRLEGPAGVDGQTS